MKIEKPFIKFSSKPLFKSARPGWFLWESRDKYLNGGPALLYGDSSRSAYREFVKFMSVFQLIHPPQRL